MKKVFSIKCVLLLLSLSVFGQATKADLNQLRKEVGLPVSTSITKADVSFPTAEPLKIYLAIKHNKRAAKDFIDWVEQWNRENSGQFGEIQIVDDLVDADIAAVQFQFGAARVVQETSARLKIGKGRRESGDDDDEFVLGGIGNSNARVENSVKTLKVPLYSYLIVRGASNSSWIVNYSRIDEKLSGKNFPELLLQTAIEDRLKNR
jgi:hypothetical protein